MRPMTVFSGGGLQRHDGEQDVLSVTPIPLRVLNERQIAESLIYERWSHLFGWSATRTLGVVSYRKTGRSQLVDATPSDVEVVIMRQGRRYGLSAAHKPGLCKVSSVARRPVSKFGLSPII
jgi:hypothetical protein